MRLLRECGEGAGLVRWSMAYGSPSERVLENLVEAFAPRARAITGFHGIPREDAEDLVQQTYLTFLVRRDEVRDPEAWLAGTLRRRCLMFWRSRRRGWLSYADAAILDTWNEPEACRLGASEQDRVELRCDLSKAIGRLPLRSRKLVRLRYGQGCDTRETAERLGYRHSGIYTITKRCLAAMARELAELGGYSSAHRRTEGRSARGGEAGDR